MRKAALLAVMTLTLVHGHARAGTIRGRLALTRAAARAQPAQPQPGIAEAVVYVEKVPDKVERKLVAGTGWLFFRHRAPNDPLRVVQADMRFKPRVLATTVGRPVTFMNLDHVYHNAFSVSAARTFDLGKYAPGKSDTVRFDRPGVVNVHCDIHPDEVGYIVVAPNHTLARPDKYGDYTLPSLPAGTYTVIAWHPRYGEIRRSVEVPKRGDVTLDLGF
jgi:plastocyanin